MAIQITPVAVVSSCVRPVRPVQAPKVGIRLGSSEWPVTEIVTLFEFLRKPSGEKSRRIGLANRARLASPNARSTGIAVFLTKQADLRHWYL